MGCWHAFDFRICGFWTRLYTNRICEEVISSLISRHCDVEIWEVVVSNSFSLTVTTKQIVTIEWSQQLLNITLEISVCAKAKHDQHKDQEANAAAGICHFSFNDNAVFDTGVPH